MEELRKILHTNQNYMVSDFLSKSQLERMKGYVNASLTKLGENPTHEELLEIPERVPKALHFLTKGYQKDPLVILRAATSKENYQQMVIVWDIDFHFLCGYHILPFFGEVHVGYIPNEYITGLNKILCIVDVFARRLQVQERLTTQIKDYIQQVLPPPGVIVVIETQRMCMQIRDVQKQNSLTTMNDFTGAFKEPRTYEKFLNLIRKS